MKIIDIKDRLDLRDQAASWFSSKWGLDRQAYVASMEEALEPGSLVTWYVVLDGEKIIAGAGVIDNDFHNRQDLSPNICSLYVEESHRGRGLAKGLLDHIVGAYRSMGISRLYLLTDHTSFYEACGWHFVALAQEDDGGDIRVYSNRLDFFEES